MATELGQAYVQIMPSAKGISGSIQKAIAPEATAAGKSAGAQMASSIAKSMGKTGKTLTKYITAPALGAATAIGGIVSTLGFKRLVGLDTAQAKLKGLGYDAKSVERISGQVETAIAGGMTTMGEGVSVAAGGLAAGVKEGKELEKYIKLVGDAAVGSGRPVDEMAQIFNRVQGGGRLMTQELNMIEMGLPGFAQAMADELAGGSLESFRKMVTNGEVGSKEFLNVMDDFAGGMAESYSESFEGMWQNTKAYVGIIGETLIGGLFEDGKKGLADFIEVLQSDAVMDWAANTGEKIRDVVHNLVDVVKDAITWWKGLSDSTKQLIGILAGVAIVAGPILLAISKIVTTFMSLIPLFKGIGIAIGAITSPVGLVITAIIAAAALIYIYWEPIKEFFLKMWTAIKDAGLLIWDNLKEGWSNAKENIMESWQGFKDFFSELWSSVTESVSGAFNSIVDSVFESIASIEEKFLGFMDILRDVIYIGFEFIEEIWTQALMTIAEITGANLEYVQEKIRFVMDSIWDIIETVWNFVKETFLNATAFLKALITGDFATMKDMVGEQMSLIRNTIKQIWSNVKNIITNFLSIIKTYISSSFNSIKSVISNILNSIRSTMTNIWNSIRNTTTSVINGIKNAILNGFNSAKNIVSSTTNAIRNIISNIFSSLRGIVSGAMSGVRGAISSGMSSAVSAVTGVAGRFKDAGRRVVTSIADGIKGAIGKVTGAMSSLASKMRDFLPFSPPKTGPLKDIMDVKWGETISGGIVKGEGIVADAMDEMLDFDLSKKAKFSNPYSLDSLEKSHNQSDRPIYLQIGGKTFAKVIGDYTSAEGGVRVRRIERGLA